MNNPIIVGWGRTSQHIELEAFGDKFTVQKCGGKWKAYDTPRSIDEIAAEHADKPGPQGEGRTWLEIFEDGEWHALDGGGAILPDSWGHWIDKDGNHWWVFGRPGKFMVQCLDAETGMPDDEIGPHRLQELGESFKGRWHQPATAREAELPCGHPASLLVTTVETGTQYCHFCDIQSRCRDAETMEAELRQQLEAVTAERDMLRDHERCDHYALDIAGAPRTACGGEGDAEVLLSISDRVRAVRKSVTRADQQLTAALAAKEAAEQRVAVLTDKGRDLMHSIHWWREGGITEAGCRIAEAEFRAALAGE